MDLDTPAYFASDAARAAGIDMLTFQNWLKRDAFGLRPKIEWERAPDRVTFSRSAASSSSP